MRIFFGYGHNSQELDKDVQRQIDELIKNLDRYPGNLQEYDDFKGAEHEIIDTGRPEKFIYLDGREEPGFLEDLAVKEGMKALIHYNPEFTYGVPVRPKKPYKQPRTEE